MYNLQLLIFTLLVLFWLAQHSVEETALDIFFPLLLFMTPNALIRLPHLPPISSSDVILVPLGIATILRRSNRWTIRRADVWVILYILAAGYTDFMNNGMTTALFNLPATLDPALFGYVIGKLLIEQNGMRERFARRLTFLVGVIGCVSVIEFVVRWNLFSMLETRIFNVGPSGGYQLRAMFLRVAGPFDGAEQAGIVFMMSFFLSVWLWYLNRTRREAKTVQPSEMRHPIIRIAASFAGLFMTLSRGPMLGTALGFLVARIGIVKNKRRATVVALVLCLVGGVLLHNKIKQYSQVDLSQGNETQLSAGYRTHLFDIYKPIAELGGYFGWSATSYPRPPGFGSIDNEYLLLWVTNGKIGLSLFVLIAAEGALAFALAIRRSEQPVDKCFYYCLEGMLLGLMFVLSTVWLVGQGLVLFFFFIGWSQSLQDQYVEVTAASDQPKPRFAFRRVFA